MGQAVGICGASFIPLGAIGEYPYVSARDGGTLKTINASAGTSRCLLETSLPFPRMFVKKPCFGSATPAFVLAVPTVFRTRLVKRPDCTLLGDQGWKGSLPESCIQTSTLVLYIRTHVHTYLCIHIPMFKNACTYIPMYIRIHKYTYVQTYLCTYIDMYIHIYVDTYTCEQPSVVYVYIYTFTHIHKNTYIHTCIHT